VISVPRVPNRLHHPRELSEEIQHPGLFLIVEQQVYKLGYFKAVHLYLRLVRWRYDEISLNCALKLHIPGRYPVDIATVEFRLPQITVEKNSPANVGPR
jgi:hypothetical protein